MWTAFGTEVNELIFNPGASAFTITNNQSWTISGTGITNNSGIAQNFVVTAGLGHLDMTNSATAGNMTFFTVTGGAPFAGSVFFNDDSTAGNATFINEGGYNGAVTYFLDRSTAAEGLFIADGALSAGTFGWGQVGLLQQANGANGIFIANGGQAPGAKGGVIYTFNSSTADHGAFYANGGPVAGAFGGRVSH